MTTQQGRALGLLIAGSVVLLSGVVVALSDAGLPLPAALVVAPLLICCVAIMGASVVGYHIGRIEGRGYWRSIGSGCGRRSALSSSCFEPRPTVRSTANAAGGVAQAMDYRCSLESHWS